MYRIIPVLSVLAVAITAIPITDELVQDLNARNYTVSPDDPNLWHVKRDDSKVSTTITFSDQKMWWGCARDGQNMVTVDPVAEINHLEDMCIQSQCDESKSYTRDIVYVNEKEDTAEKATLTLTAEGEFPTWMRNGLVQALQTAAGAKGLINTHSNVKFMNPFTCGSHGCNQLHCDVKEFSAFVGIKITSDDDHDSIVARIAGTFKIEGKEDSGFCKGADIATAVSGALGPFGAVVGGFLGTIKATQCD